MSNSMKLRGPFPIAAKVTLGANFDAEAAKITKGKKPVSTDVVDFGEFEGKQIKQTTSKFDLDANGFPETIVTQSDQDMTLSAWVNGQHTEIEAGPNGQVRSIKQSGGGVDAQRLHSFQGKTQLIETERVKKSNVPVEVREGIQIGHSDLKVSLSTPTAGLLEKVKLVAAKEGWDVELRPGQPAYQRAGHDMIFITEGEKVLYRIALGNSGSVHFIEENTAQRQSIFMSDANSGVSHYDWSWKASKGTADAKAEYTEYHHLVRHNPNDDDVFVKETSTLLP